MATETIVAVFDTAAQAEEANRQLAAAGVPSGSVQNYAQSTAGYGQVGSTHTESGQGFWGWLFGEDKVGHDRTIYDRTVESGGTVLTVIVEDSQADRVASILEANSPVDLEQRASEYGLTSGGASAAAGTRTSAATSGTVRGGDASVAGANRSNAEQVVPLAEETLEVGKRGVGGGTTRLRRYVVERPVEEQVRLRNEHVSVERRPVSGSGAVAPDAFTEKTIEVTETSEEAVIAKTARVKEEVVVRKEVDERVETVRDTVRREEVEVDTPTNQPKTSGTTAPPS